MTKSEYRKKFNKIAHPFCSRRYSDEAWQGVKELSEAVREAFPGCDMDVWVENGGYRNFFSDGGKYKEYCFSLTTPEGYELIGVIDCHAAGAVEDPFKTYDMTASIW